MKKGYYIHFNARDTVGASKKIDMQLGVFRRYYDMEEVVIRLSTRSYVKNAAALLPFGSLLWDYETARQSIKAPDFLYIRKALYDREGYLFLKHVKEKYPKCRILSEIHTWPYFKTAFFSKTGMLAIKDRIYAQFAKKYVDRYLTFSDDDEILGVPTIRILNGIQVHDVPIVSREHFADNAIRLIMVAVMAEHHGYDRLLKGLFDYYRKNGRANFILNIVGDGKCKQKYEQLSCDLNLGEHVRFYGEKVGEELDALYNRADLGMSSFGWYRCNVKRSSALKVREYLARGLPVVSGCTEDVFEGTDHTYCLEFPNNPVSIDFARIEEYYHKIYDGKEKGEVARQIRNFAYDKIDMELVMKPIIKYLGE